MGVTEDKIHHYSVPQRVMIIAGGTGGHVMPALSVAQFLRGKGVAIHWIGTRQGIEARLVPQAHIPISFIDIQGFRGKRGAWLLAPWRIAKAMWQAYRLVRKQCPHVVLSMGGYVAGPGALVAYFLRIPLVLHEQNAIPGWTNRFLAKFAQRIMVAFPNVFNEFPAKVVFTGNPVRQEITTLAPPQIRYSMPIAAQCRILILGGSLGAMKLNELVPQALALLCDKPLEIWHQTGTQHLEKTREYYENLKRPAKLCAFIEDMAKAYAFADIVICRSGALTIAELSSVGVASILIPFPYAVDDHQMANAQYLSERGAAFLVPQAILTASALYHLLLELIENPTKRLAMAMACRRLAKPLATSDVAQLCLEAVTNK